MFDNLVEEKILKSSPITEKSVTSFATEGVTLYQINNQTVRLGKVGMLYSVYFLVN